MLEYVHAETIRQSANEAFSTQQSDRYAARTLFIYSEDRLPYWHTARTALLIYIRAAGRSFNGITGAQTSTGFSAAHAWSAILKAADESRLNITWRGPLCRLLAMWGERVVRRWRPRGPWPRRSTHLADEDVGELVIGRAVAEGEADLVVGRRPP